MTRALIVEIIKRLSDEVATWHCQCGQCVKRKQKELDGWRKKLEEFDAAKEV